MAARYWIQISDHLLEQRDHLRWPGGFRLEYVPDKWRSDPVMIPADRWCLVYDEEAPAELDGAHVMLTLQTDGDNAPRIIDRRPYDVVPRQANITTAYMRVYGEDDDTVDCDCPPGDPPWRLRDLFAPVIGLLLRGQRQRHAEQGTSGPGRQPDRAGRT